MRLLSAYVPLVSIKSPPTKGMSLRLTVDEELQDNLDCSVAIRLIADIGVAFTADYSASFFSTQIIRFPFLD